MHLQLLFVCLFAQDDLLYQVPFQELMVRISYTQMILYTFLLHIRFRNIRFLYYLSFCLCKSLQRTLVVLRFLTHCGCSKPFGQTPSFSKASAKVHTFYQSTKCF